jgi:hypothetical protein
MLAYKRTRARLARVWRPIWSAVTCHRFGPPALNAGTGKATTGRRTPKVESLRSSAQFEDQNGKDS